jgi:hypothetical protein
MENFSGYWIYPGERRPVVVKAESREEAEELIRNNKQYDGFGAYAYRIEEFAKMCDEKRVRQIPPSPNG